MYNYIIIILYILITKYHRLGGLKNGHLFSGSPRSMYEQGWVLVRPLVFACRRLTSYWVLMTFPLGVCMFREGWGERSLCLFLFFIRTSVLLD